MNCKIRHRLIAATALAALLAGGSALAAAPQHRDDGHGHQARKEHRQDRRKDHKHQRHAAKPAAAQRHVVQRHAVKPQARTAARHRAELQRRAAVQSRHDDRRDARRTVRRDVRHDTHRRVAYERYRHDYERRRHDHVQVRIVPRYYIRPAHYRYAHGGRWYTTSNYGAEMLRIAVQNGYREGLRAGQADRFDGFPGGFRDSFAWQDAAYGWGPGYIGRAEYSHYFRQGFERGYQDGYYGRMRYGHYVSGEAIIVEAVLGAILNLQTMR